MGHVYFRGCGESSGLGSLADGTGPLCRHAGYSGEDRGLGRRHSPVDIPVGDRCFVGCFPHQGNSRIPGGYLKAGL